MAPVTIGYWNIRGLAHFIKLMLEYTGTEYVEDQYKVGPAPDFDDSSWFSVKFTKGFDFPNLPYYIDGNVKITQSLAIGRYLARKNDLYGKTEEEKIKIDMLEQQHGDVQTAFYDPMYSDKWTDEKKNHLIEYGKKAMKQFSEFLGNNKWFAGDSLTYADFLMFNVIELYYIFEPSILSDFANLKEFLKNFKSLEPISKYLKSSRAIAQPFCLAYAVHGGQIIKRDD